MWAVNQGQITESWESKMNTVASPVFFGSSWAQSIPLRAATGIVGPPERWKATWEGWEG